MRSRVTATIVGALSVIALAGCGADDDPAPTADGAAAATPGPGESGTSAVTAAAGSPAAGVAAGDRDVVDVSTLGGEDCPPDTAEADFPDVVGATFTPVDGGTEAWQVAATLCSLYDTSARYADAWRVVTPAGDVLGTRELLHDHAGEQPFTRSLSSPIIVPSGVSTVVVEARDQSNGWGGTTLEVDLTSD